MLTLFLLVLMLAVVQDFCNGCLLILGDDDQIEIYTFRQFEGFTGVSQATVIVLVINEKNLGGSDLPIDKLFCSDGNFLRS